MNKNILGVHKVLHQQLIISAPRDEKDLEVVEGGTVVDLTIKEHENFGDAPDEVEIKTMKTSNKERH